LKSSKYIFLLLIFCLGLPGSSLGSKYDKAKKKYYHEKVEKSIMSELDLTDDQEFQLNQLDITNEIANLKIKSQILTLKDLSRKELFKEIPSQSTLDSIAVEFGKVYEEITKISHNHFLEVKKILTSEQYERLLSSGSRKDLRRAASSGYDKEDYDPNATLADLVGTWTLKEIYSDKGEEKIYNLTYTFKENGSGRINREGEPQDIEWSLITGILVITVKKESEKMEAYIVDGDLYLVGMDQRRKMRFMQDN